MSPAATVLVTFLATGSLIIPGLASAMLMAGAMYVVVILRRSTRAMFAIPLLLTLPLALPLLFLHGILNPAFPESHRLYDLLPLRLIGFQYAMGISARIFALTCLAILWRCVNREDLFEAALQCKIPMPVVVLLAVSVSNLVLTARRIEAVYLAQQARGIPSGPGIFARLRAFPSIVIPVAVSTLVEAVARGSALSIRGLGSHAIVPIGDARALTCSKEDWGTVMCLTVAVVIAILIL